MAATRGSDLCREAQDAQWGHFPRSTPPLRVRVDLLESETRRTGAAAIVTHRSGFKHVAAAFGREAVSAQTDAAELLDSYFLQRSEVDSGSLSSEWKC